MLNKFDKRLENLPQDIYDLIEQIDSIKEEWKSGAKLGPQFFDRLKKSVIITSTGSSTRIEGAELSDEDIERLMRGVNISKFKDRDKQEVQGYYEALSNVFESYKSISFSEGVIKFFHRELLKYTEKDKNHRGEYKSTENKVVLVGDSNQVLFETTPPHLVSKEMQELIEWTQDAFLKRRFHPLIIIGNFVIEFLLIHPFIDGNGRLSRILSNLLLLQRGYEYMPYISQEKLIEDNKPEYYLSLRKNQKTFRTNKEDVLPWMSFFLKIILKQSQEAIKLLSKKEVEKLLSAQQKIIWDFINDFSGEISPLEIFKNTRIPRPTINQAISKFLKFGLIERIGLGRGTRYIKK